MVEWLREVGMPADYVNKLARMFQDIKISEDLNQLFKTAHKLTHLKKRIKWQLVTNRAVSMAVSVKTLNVLKMGM